MSEDELVSAYADGRITRRSFIKRLVATGVTVTSAVAFADLIAQPALAKGHGPAQSTDGEDEHDENDQGEDEHDQGDDDQGDDDDQGEDEHDSISA